MSNSLVAQVFTLNVPRPSKFVLLAMAELADANGNSKTSVNQIVIMTGYGNRQVRRVMKSLIIDGLITPITAGAEEAAVYSVRIKHCYDNGGPCNKIKDNE